MEINKNEIIESVNAAQDYIQALTGLENEVKNAEKQIETSANDAEILIKQSFSNLLTEIKKTLENRQQLLLQQIDKVRERSLKPLRDCRNIIVTKIDNTKTFKELANNVMTDNRLYNAVTFEKNMSMLGSLPEVPQLKEVPYISYHYESVVYKDIIDSCKTLGSIQSIAPVQIASLVEKPGSVLVEFISVEQEDKLTDIQEYRLQKAYLNDGGACYQDCYIGPETQFLVRDLQVNEVYLFRVCCKFEGASTWSSWSIPQSGKTTIKPYSWKDHLSFILRNEHKIAKPNDDVVAVLYSNGPQFHVGYSIEFVFLECDIKLEGTFIGLSLHSNFNTPEELMCDSLLVEATGAVYVNGIKKSTRLPEMQVGSKVCFRCELLNESKILMSVECSGKQVTYDWSMSADDKMYFLASFNSTKWKIMVE
ncbi:hypothetical protein QE152_g29447 [Popillia japonica]|uniref:Fibronectin type-III domain-containing protein n=1 Tax=Popillia japonica TaxID=7064 RepID=A0AAW1JHZ2_POPJA